jgi:hypothetical protein
MREDRSAGKTVEWLRFSSQIRADKCRGESEDRSARETADAGKTVE